VAVELAKMYLGIGHGIQWSTHNCEKQERTGNNGWMLYTVYAVPGVCCSQY